MARIFLLEETYDTGKITGVKIIDHLQDIEDESYLRNSIKLGNVFYISNSEVANTTLGVLFNAHECSDKLLKIFNSANKI